ncbi:hypothetical protein [Bosea sp. Root483D1]|uniref:hypothetical protein n=1 Tax=Bosea sp. Root483D1 TaxID=1736544 RepID=UPI000AB6CCF0|nr:hypothetical protein [Bosea sp. Root483D1]
MITPEPRIEHIARAMCRAAGFDPDEQIPPETPQSDFASMQPALGMVFAWRRFLLAAENYCALSHDLAEPERLPPAL